MNANDLQCAASRERRRQLTEQIKSHAAGAQSKGRHPVRVGHAVACGKALSELKELVDRGDWGRCIEQECALNRMTANRYMRLASNANRLTPYMTIRAAYLAAGVITPKPS